jgi:hypothetical protein
MPQPTEFDLQRALSSGLMAIPTQRRPRTTPALAPERRLFPRSERRRSRLARGEAAEAIGVKAGVPDLVFLALSAVLLPRTERARRQGRLSPAQLAMHPRLIDAGATALATLDNLAEAKAWCVR